MSQFHYVVVEGPIGAGKSDLAQRLADHWQVKLVAETPEENPFLLRFYHNAAQLALAAQLSFLKQRAEIAHDMLQGDLLVSPVVSDFLFDKDAVFARLILDDDEFALYRYIAAKLMPEYPVPDLVIYLQASEEVVHKRVAARGNDYEKRFPEGYLSRIHSAYSEFFHQYEAAPVLIVNTDHLDFVNGDEDFELLLRCISEMRGQRSYFNKSI